MHRRLFAAEVEAALPETARSKPLEIWFQDEAHHPYLGRAWNTAPRDTRYICYIFGAVCPERAEAAALIMPHADTQAMSAHLAEMLKPSHRAHMPFSFWMALAGTVRQSWYPTTSPCSNSRPIPLNSTRWKMCGLICVPTSSPYPSSTIMSRSSTGRSMELLCKRQNRNHVNHYQTMGQNGQRLGPLV